MRVLGIVGELLSRRDRPVEPFDPASPLYEQGLALDSLEVAELSALLESRLGSDPFTVGELPQTIGDIVRYYETATPPASWGS